MEPEAIVEAYGGGTGRYPGGRPLAPDAARAWSAVQEGGGRLGTARLRDSARREWIVEVRRDPARGRTLVASPAHGDLEPFRASADGHGAATHLPITGVAWTVLALLAAGHDGDAGRDDEALRDAAFRLLDRMVREAQHGQLLGAAEDEEDEP